MQDLTLRQNSLGPATNSVNLSTLTKLTCLDLSRNRRVTARASQKNVQPGCCSLIHSPSALPLPFAPNQIPSGTTLSSTCMRYRQHDVLATLVGLTGLRSLDLSTNSITAEKLEATPLTAQHLTHLSFACNPLKTLPASIAALASLADLNLTGTLLTSLPAGRYLGAC